MIADITANHHKLVRNIAGFWVEFGIGIQYATKYLKTENIPSI